MRYSINKGLFIIFLMIFIYLLSACNAGQIFGDPDVIFNDALSHFKEHEQIGLFGTSEAAATGYSFVEADTLYTVSDQQWVKVNAKINALEEQNARVTSDVLLSIEQLEKVDKNVTIDTEYSNADKIVIHLDIEEAELKAVIKQNLQRKLEQVEQRVAAGARHGKQHHLDSRKAVEKAEGKLIEMLSTLEVEAAYQMGVDSRTHVPQTLDVTTILKYKVQGMDKQDTLRGAYEFKVFDKDVLIPQNL